MTMTWSPAQRAEYLTEIGAESSFLREGGHGLFEESPHRDDPARAASLSPGTPVPGYGGRTPRTSSALAGVSAVQGQKRARYGLNFVSGGTPGDCGVMRVTAPPVVDAAPGGWPVLLLNGELSRLEAKRRQWDAEIERCFRWRRELDRLEAQRAAWAAELDRCSQHLQRWPW
jgi:hypothetical protein